MNVIFKNRENMQIHIIYKLYFANSGLITKCSIFLSDLSYCLLTDITLDFHIVTSHVNYKTVNLFCAFYIYRQTDKYIPTYIIDICLLFSIHILFSIFRLY